MIFAIYIIGYICWFAPTGVKHFINIAIQSLSLWLADKQGWNNI